VTEKFRFRETINLPLHRDEAIVLLWYLSRELNEDNLRDGVLPELHKTPLA
jgi:hypothetical protein